MAAICGVMPLLDRLLSIAIKSGMAAKWLHKLNRAFLAY